jgi:hypothetical protein
MRARVLSLLLVASLFVPATAAARTDAGPRLVFRAATHTPKVNARWPWSVVVTTAAGRRLPATVSVAIVDPIGGVHPVEYGCCKGRFITNVKTQGRFADYVQFPLSAKGFRLTFRVTVKTRLGKRTVSYWVKAR